LFSPAQDAIVDIEVPNPRRYELLSISRYPEYLYPLSDGDSTFYRRITKSYFVPARLVDSQLTSLISLHSTRDANHDERSFELLRYFWRIPPSQTTRLTLSISRFTGKMLEFRLFKTGISPLTPAALTTTFTVSHYPTYKNQKQYQSIVKVHGVFRLVAGKQHLTATTISPSLPLRHARSLGHSCSRNYPTRNFAHFIPLMFHKSWTLS